MIFEIGYPQISDLMKIRLVGAEVFRANRDRLTDGHHNDSRFSQFRERAKKEEHARS